MNLRSGDLLSRVVGSSLCLGLVVTLPLARTDIAAQQSYDPPGPRVMDRYKGRCAQDAYGKSVESACTITVTTYFDGRTMVAWLADREKATATHVSWLGNVKDGRYTAQEKKPNFFMSGGGVLTNQEIDVVLTQQMTPREGKGATVVERLKGNLEARVDPTARAAPRR